MIKLGEKIKIGEDQDLIIYNDGIVVETFNEIRDYSTKKETYLYKDFIENAELRKHIEYDKVFYYNENGEEIQLADNIYNTYYLISLTYNDKNNKETYEQLSINNKELGLEIVKKINHYTKEIVDKYWEDRRLKQ